MLKRLSFLYGLTTILTCLLSAYILAPSAQAQSPDQAVYTDALQNGWQNYGWAALNYGNTDPVHAGNTSISVTVGAYQALYLHHAAQNSSPYTGITFWINGGAAGGQKLQVQATLNGKEQPPVIIAPLQANSWQQVTIPLSQLGAANTPNFDGFWIQDTTGMAAPTFYVDDITLSSSNSVPAATSANVTVNAGAVIRTLDNRMYGLNTAIYDSHLGESASQILLAQMQTSILRFPGGSESDSYDWSTDRSDGYTWQWASSFAVFAQLAESAHAQAFITVNYGSGTPEMAEAWVAYANGSPANASAIGIDAQGRDWKTVGYWAALRGALPLATDDGFNFLRAGHSSPYGFRYWEIGNECFGIWENDLHGAAGSGLSGSAHDASTYAGYFARFSQKMKAADLTVKVGIVGDSSEDGDGDGVGGVANPNEYNTVHSGWTPVVLATLKKSGAIPDFITYHRYPQLAGFVDGSDASLLQRGSLGWAAEVQALRKQLTDYVGGAAGAGVELVATETNSGYQSSDKQGVSLVNGLFYADTLAQAAQTEINSIVWWDFRNGEGAVSDDASLYGWRLFADDGMVATGNISGTPANTPYPAFYAAKLLTHWARGGDQVVSAGSSNTLLAVYPAKLANGDLSVLVINKDPSNDIIGHLTVVGFTPGSSTATVYQYGKPQDLSGADITQSTINNASPIFSYTFPSYSMTTIILSAPVISLPMVSGSVSLQSWLGAPQPLTFTLKPTASTAGAPLSQTLTPAADGSFALPNVPFGTYTLAVKGSRWLQRDLPVDATGGNVSGLSVSLLAGDLDGDNAVGASDLAILRAAYGTTSASSRWNPLADLNGDGLVTLSDLALLRANFGKTGNP